jgi:hypothetical protein
MRFAEKMNSPSLKAKVEAVAQSKGIMALIAQGIAKNFEDEGPGWVPLKVATIKGSVSKARAKKLGKVSDHELLSYESLIRKRGKTADDRERLEKISAKIHGKKQPKYGPAPNRMILQKTGLLKKTVTTPGASGSTGGKRPISGRNV